MRTRGVLRIATFALLLMAGCGRGSSAAESPPTDPPPASTEASVPEEPAVTLADLDSSIPIFESISTPPTGAPAGRLGGVELQGRRELDARLARLLEPGHLVEELPG